MAFKQNHSDYTQVLEHDQDGPETKKVSLYGWDVDNLQKVKLVVNSSGSFLVPVGASTETKQDDQMTQITNLTNINTHTGSNELRVFSQGHVCAENSTSTPLGASQEFVGAWQDTLDYSEIIATIYTDKNSTTDGFKIWWSADGSTSDPDPDVFTITAGVSKTFSFPCNRRFVKITYQNDGEAQGVMLLSTALKRFASKGSSHRLADTLNQQDDAIVTKSLVAGKTTGGGGGIVDVKVTPSGALTVESTVPGVATSAKQDSQIALETSLNSLIETLQELSQRLAPLGGAMSNTAQLRAVVTGAVTATGGGYVTSAQVIAALLTQTNTLRLDPNNTLSIQSNINNVVVT